MASARASSSSDASASSTGGLVLPALDTRGKVAVAVAALCGVGAAAFVAYRVARRRRDDDATWSSSSRGGPDASRRWETKVVYLIRHGQSTFNAAYARDGVDPMLFDAPLSALGRRQVATLRDAALASAARARRRGEASRFAGDDDSDASSDSDSARLGGGGASGGRSATTFAPMPEVVLCSPLTRALQTAVGAFEGTPARVEVLPELREHLTKSCDVGRPVGELVAEFPRADFERMARRVAADPSSSSPTGRSTSQTDVAALDVAALDPSTSGPGAIDSRVWWYVDPEADPPQDTAEACRRDFASYGFIEPEAALRRRVAEVYEHVRTREERCVALVGHADFFVRLAARMEGPGPDGALEELWLENCGVASFEIRVPPAVASEGRRARRRAEKEKRASAAAATPRRRLEYAIAVGEGTVGEGRGTNGFETGDAGRTRARDERDGGKRADATGPSPRVVA